MTQYQAHRVLIWAGRMSEARALLPRLLLSDLPAENKALAQMRQACAEGWSREARARWAEVPDPDMTARWNAAQLLGNAAAADAELRPLDTPEGWPTLIQFMINPTFEPRHFPGLSSRLAREGVMPPEAVPTPYACGRG